MVKKSLEQRVIKLEYHMRLMKRYGTIRLLGMGHKL